MELNELLRYGLSVVSGGALAGFLTYKVSTKKQKLSEFEVLLGKYKELHDTLEVKVNHLEDEYQEIVKDRDKLRDEVVHLRNQLQLFESSVTDLPLPMWTKSKNGIMLHMNEACEQMVLEPLGLSVTDYIGKKDEEIWGEELAKSYAKTDAKIKRYKKAYESIEPVSDGKNTYYAHVLKYPRKINGDVIGISGVILRTAETMEELK